MTREYGVNKTVKSKQLKKFYFPLIPLETGSAEIETEISRTIFNSMNSDDTVSLSYHKGRLGIL
jgi:hypothetical protein